jgi:hypothetical protein
LHIPFITSQILLTLVDADFQAIFQNILSPPQVARLITTHQPDIQLVPDYQDNTLKPLESNQEQTL